MVTEQFTLKKRQATGAVPIEAEGTTTDQLQTVTEIVVKLTRMDPQGWLDAPVEELERWEAEQGFDKADDL